MTLEQTMRAIWHRWEWDGDSDARYTLDPMIMLRRQAVQAQWERYYERLERLAKDILIDE
tara:strand:+ start:778 stop:957 length:180 start_codon:yes stop_codon:yes gene_type:complete